MTQVFQRLQALCQTKGDELEKLSEVDPNGFVFRQAEHLVESIEGTRIRGVEKLAKDGLANLGKFENLLSELRFALLFNAVGADVEILQDDAFFPAQYTPDLLVTLPTGLRILVEVVHGSIGSPQLSDSLTTSNGVHVKVEYILGERLSTPGVSRTERTNNQDLVDRVEQELMARIEGVMMSAQQQGLVHVFESSGIIRSTVQSGSNDVYVDDEQSQEPGWLASFGFEPSGSPSGAVGGITAVRFINDDEQRKGLLRKLKEKSKKRAKLPNDYTSLPYLVALDNEVTDLTPVAVLSTLTGSRGHILRASGSPIVPPEKVLKVDAAWMPLLKEWKYVERNDTRFSEYGGFFEEKESWAENLSGVLVLHHSRTVCQWLPNPFACVEINEPKLLNIGLAYDMLGSQSPTL